MQPATDVKLTTLATVLTRVPPLAGEQRVLPVQERLDVGGARPAAGELLDRKNYAGVRLPQLKIVGAADVETVIVAGVEADIVQRARCSQHAHAVRDSSTNVIFDLFDHVVGDLDVEIAVPCICEDVDAAHFDATDGVPSIVN